jgi:predicted nucleotidyltransferase
MEFTIEKKSIPSTEFNATVLDLTYAFSKEAHKEFGELIKALVLFGSSARKDVTSSSDIDLLIIFNDVTITPTDELVETYKIISEKLIAKVSKRIHLTTVAYSTFIDQVRTGDPLAINILRDGIPILDTGFFEPFQVLLRQGKMRPTYEAIWTYYNKAPLTLQNSRRHILRACEDLYWAVTDAAHAAIMRQGISPTSPKFMPKLFEEHLLKNKHFSKKHVKTLQFFIDLYKSLQNRDIKDLTGSQYESYYLEAREFILDVESFLQKHK